MVRCIVCGHIGDELITIHKPRDRKLPNIVDCLECEHWQLFLFLTEDEISEEYA